MMRSFTSLAALAVVFAASTTAFAEQQKLHRVKVQVVDIGGGRAFLTPGAESGLEKGTEVVFRPLRLKVSAVTSSYAVVELEENTLKIGRRGVALVREKADRDADLPHREVPPPLESFHGSWSEALPPSTEQQPEHVPLGRVRGQRVNVALSVGTAASIGLQGQSSIVRGDLRARLLAEPIKGVPFRIDADIAGQFWYSSDIDQRDGDASRPYLRVRTLQLSYGEVDRFYTALGRLRYAASTLGMLDGLRIQSPSLRGVTIGAFGGLVPHPFTGIPDWHAGRFGAEVAYQNASSKLRPMAALVFHGSVFGGSIDERRLSLSTGLYPGDSRVGAHVEAAFHDKVNRWNVPVAELAAAGIDGSYRISWFEVGGRFDMRRPERSRWLDSILPSSWLCTATITSTGEPEPCAGVDDTRYFGSLDTGFRFDRGSVHLGATLLHFADTQGLDQVGGFIQGRLNRILGVGRVGASFMVSHGSLLDTYAGRLTVGGSFFRGIFDVSLHYRLSFSRYEADIEGWWGHLFGGAFLVHAIPDLYISLQTDGVVGRDLNALMLQALVTWSPSF